MIWFRLHTDLLHDPKVQRLSPEHFKIYINCLCYAGQRDKDGTIGNISDVSFVLHETEKSVSSAFHELELKHLIAPNVTDNETFHIPQWNKKQYKSDTSTERVRKHRVSKKRSKTVTVTPPETEADTDTDTEELEAKASCQSTGTIDALKIIELWNNKGLGKLTEVLPARRQKINSRTKDRLKDIQAWDDYFQMFADSHFLSGGKSNWKASFDWALNPTNMMKVIEGNYDNNSGSNGFDPVEYNRRKQEEEMKDG